LGSSGSLSTIVARGFKDTGVIVPKGVRVGSHIFRHTFASRLLRAEEPLKNISDMLGHRYYDSTMVYAKIDMTGLKNATLNWEDSYYENF
jgi:integrase/recombinase XerD